MQNLLLDCIDELCLKCGKYETEYEGSCDGCKWHKIKNGKRTSSDDAMKDMAEDLKYNCRTNTCRESGYDEYGNEYVSYTCPFYINETCVLGEPAEWDL